MNIKPIETYYRGYRFRSRLEARWAVFFDAAHIRWEYEKEGFDLGKHGYYLPDFYLPDFGCFVEIKPEKGMTDQVENQLRALSHIAPTICFQGVPSLSWRGWDGGTLFCWDLCDSGGGAYQNEISWCYCNSCNKFTLSISDNDPKLLRGDRTLFRDENFQHVWTELCDPEHRDHHEAGACDFPINKARAARFEHGETPD